MDIPLLPQPLVEYSDNYYAFDITSEAETWNQGVWDAVTASRPDIQLIEQQCANYKAGFIAGLNYRLTNMTIQKPIELPLTKEDDSDYYPDENDSSTPSSSSIASLPKDNYEPF